MDDMNKWATSLINTHKNPVKHLDVVPNKFLLSTGSKDEIATVNKFLNNTLCGCSADRVDRRCARSVGHWLADKRLVHVIKINGIVNTFGFANKNGKYLYPEEAMFLLETNRIEILWNNVPITIQQAYEVILSDIQRYLQYRKLTLEGFRLLQKSKDAIEPPIKKICSTPSVLNQHNPVLKKLQEAGPKFFVSESVKDDFDYNMYLPEHSNKGPADLKLYISPSKTIPADICLISSKSVTGYTNMDSSCFQYCRVTLPDLT